MNAVSEYKMPEKVSKAYRNYVTVGKSKLMKLKEKFSRRLEEE